jgi:hypothetical protein
MKSVIATLSTVIVLTMMLWSCNEDRKSQEVARCDRDEILFNRTTEMIGGDCYVLMDDDVWLPQIIYWHRYYIKGEHE